MENKDYLNALKAKISWILKELIHLLLKSKNALSITLVADNGTILCITLNGDIILMKERILQAFDVSLTGNNLMSILYSEKHDPSSNNMIDAICWNNNWLSADCTNWLSNLDLSLVTKCIIKLKNGEEMSVLMPELCQSTLMEEVLL